MVVTELKSGVERVESQASVIGVRWQKERSCRCNVMRVAGSSRCRCPVQCVGEAVAAIGAHRLRPEVE